MPILDPLIQFRLASRKPNYELTPDMTNSKFFIQKYLRIASYTLCTNLESTLAYIKFKNDFKQSIDFLNVHFKSFKHVFYPDDINSINIYDQIYQTISTVPENLDGDYILVQSINSSFNFFEPHIVYSEFRSWFLTDTSYAVLCLRTKGITGNHFKLIQLEADLLEASGLTLVLVISLNSEKDKDIVYFLTRMFTNYRFAEIHINYEKSEYSKTFHELLSNIYKGSINFDSYFYIYKQFINDSNKSINDFEELCKTLKKNTRTRIINFGNAISLSFKDYKVLEGATFNYCCNSNQNEKVIKIILCDVPLYDSEDDNKISVEFANISNNYYVGFISPDDYLYWEKSRVEVLFYVSQDNYMIKYVNFEDLHSINPHLYVSHPINLARVKIDELKAIDFIINGAEEKYELKQDDTFKREFFFSLFKEKRAISLLKYVLYAYKKYAKKHNSSFKFYKSQVFVALRAIYFCIRQEDSDDNRGFVYQVSTGEGKSFIVILIAAVLALFKKMFMLLHQI